MIGNIEGALSSRRKRAVLIIDGHAAKSRYFSRAEKSAGCFLTADKGENDVFSWVEVFSSRHKKT
jgi:hypothetical protein